MQLVRNLIVVFLILVEMYAAGAHANSCLVFYSHRPAKILDLTEMKAQMDRYAADFIAGMQSTDGLTVQYHSSAIALLKIQSHLNTDLTQFDQAFSIITLENPHYLDITELGNSFTKRSKDLDEAIKSLQSAKASKKSKPEQVAELAIDVKDKFDGLKWILSEFKVKQQLLPNMNTNLANEYERISKLEGQLEVNAVHLTTC